MAATLYLRIDGTIDQVVSAKEKARALKRGVTFTSSGQLCTACLMGRWGMSQLNMHQTLCDTCLTLENIVAAACGLEATQSVVAGITARGRSQSAWEEAVNYRRLRVVELFDHAVLAGIPMTERTVHHGKKMPALPIRVLEREGIISTSVEDRVERYAAWLKEFLPDNYAVCAAELTNVATLATQLRRADRDRDRSSIHVDASRAWHEVTAGMLFLAESVWSIAAAWFRR